MKTVCVDFDGTIHDPYVREPGYKMGTPLVDAKWGIGTLRAQGYEVIVCTARPQVEHVKRWLEYFGIEVDGVTHEKPLADIYIDDRGLHFDGDWATTLREVNGRLHL